MSILIVVFMEEEKRLTYSRDFREKVLSVKAKENLSFAKVAERFGIGMASVVRWGNRIEAKETRNKKPTKIDVNALKEDVKNYPDAYQHERAKRFGVTAWGIGNALRRLGVTYKKNPQSPQGGPRKTVCILPNCE
jgi:transposase